MYIQLRNTSLIVGKQRREIDLLSFFRKGSWLLIVAVSILYSVVGSRDLLNWELTTFETWVYVHLNFLSFVLGVLAGAVIFLRKPNSWTAYAISLMLVTFTATDHGFTFWYWTFTTVPPSTGVVNDGIPYAISLFISVFYAAILTSSLVFVLLTFPEDRFPSVRVRRFFGLLLVIQGLLIGVIGIICLIDVFFGGEGWLMSDIYDLLDLVKSFLLLLLAPWQLLRLRRISDPLKRQQIKWIAASLIIMTILFAIDSFVYFFVETSPLFDAWLFLASLVFTYLFIISLLIAIVRYRLWDMSILFNKALVYSSMTAVLGVIGFAGVRLLEIYAEKYLNLGTNSNLVGGLILLPLAAIFYPVRDALQGLVDRHFKPEELDISSAIVELAPDAQLMLSSPDILRILVRQTVLQLNLAHASIHLRQPDGQILQVEPAVADPQAPQLSLDGKTLMRLEKGEVVVPNEGAPFSLYIPLLIKRAVRPDFLGVLVFGPRNSGEGYPTPVLKSLQKLGCDAGKAIYLAQLREHLGQNVMERLASIERGLSTLRQSGQFSANDPNTPVFPA